MRLRPFRLLAGLLLLLPVVPAAPAAMGLAAQTAPVKDPLDINTATAEQLKSLPGIGDAYAARIIKGRPYTAKNQLSQRGILPDAVYSKIRDSIIARRVQR